MKIAVTTILCCLISFASVAQSEFDYFDEQDPNRTEMGMSGDSVRDERQVPHYRITWKWMHNGVYRKLLPTDTLNDCTQNSNLISKHSIANSYLGNFPSPYESDIFIERAPDMDFYILKMVRAYLLRPGDIPEYNTTTPYTRLQYFNGGGKAKSENWLDVIHVQNIYPYWSAGFRYNLISSGGAYPYQKSKAYSLSAFTSYEKERTVLSFFVNQNVGHFNENGGILDPSEMRDTIMNSLYYQTQLNFEPNNNYINFNLYGQAQYNLGKGKMIITKADTTKPDTLSPPALSQDTIRPDTAYTYPMKAAISFRMEDNQYRWHEEQVETAYFNHITYVDSAKNTDNYKNKVFEADFKLIVNEHPRLTYLPGIYAGLKYKHLSYRKRFRVSEQPEEEGGTEEGEEQETTPLPSDFSTNKLYGTYLTAGIFNVDTNALFNFDAYGEFCLFGDHSADYALKGELTQYLRRDRNAFIQAKASLENSTPNAFLEFYLGNHDSWENHFDKISTQSVEGSFHNIRRRTNIGVGLKNTKGYIYFDENGAPAQYNAELLVLTAWIKQVFRLGHFYFDQKVYYQLSNKTDVLSLPMLSLYSHNYYQNIFFKGALGFQVGVDLFYNTAFYADAYRPSVMQFHRQRVEKTGDYPKLDLFVVLKIKRADIFVKAEHISQYFANRNYYTALYYPINPFKIKYGVSWRFFD